MATFDSRHEAALRYLFHEVEAVGLASTFGALCERLAFGTIHKRRTREPKTNVALGELFPVEAWSCWSRIHDQRWTRRAERALQRIEPLHRRVLRAHYGPRPAGGPRPEFGPHAVLAPFTPALLDLHAVHGPSSSEELARILAKDVVPGKEETKADVDARRAAHKARRHAVISRVRNEAPLLLESAKGAFAGVFDAKEDA